MNVRFKLGFARVAFVATLGSAMARLIFASNAFAQAPPASPPTEAVAERVIVTGSNIPTAQEQASIPVTTIHGPVAPEIGREYADGRIASASYLCRKRRDGK